MPRGRPTLASKPTFQRQWDDLTLPNAGRPTQTPASLNIDLHYAKLHVWERWTFDRYVRLAKFLNLTLYELASLACLDHRQIPILENRNRLFKGGARDRSGALVLTLLEAFVCKQHTNDIVADVFPDLNTAHGNPSNPQGAFVRNPSESGASTIVQ